MKLQRAERMSAGRGRPPHGRTAEPAQAAPALRARTLARRPGDQGTRRLAAGAGPRGVQPKLAINTPGDAFEREADRVADAVVGGVPAGTGLRAAGAALRRCACGGTCAACRGEEEPGMLHREEGGAGASPGFAPAIVHDVLSSPGRPLERDTRGFMEERLGADLDGVRVHTDARAAESARAVNAYAYTVGGDIVFSAGRYAPGTQEGDRLIAHELAHVVQQGGGAAAPLLQRQLTAPIPGFDTLDPCIEVPKGLPAPFDIAGGQKVCGSDAEKLRDLLKKKQKVGPVTADCSLFPGFQPATSGKFLGQCCQGSLRSEENCCPPERIAIIDNRCCTSSEFVQNGRCVKFTLPSICMPGQATTTGKCCSLPEIPLGSQCVLPGKTAPAPPAAPAPSTRTFVIGFEKDAPQPWYHPAASFGVSVTGTGKTAFKSLEGVLRMEPQRRVQLDGHASTDKPQGDAAYNDRLAARRVRLIASELMKKGVAASRFQNLPGGVPASCVEVDTGRHACGDTQAGGLADPADRKVVARVFG